jgi:hypothetical protein
MGGAGGGPLMGGGVATGMAVGKGVGGNKKCPRMLVGIEVSHTSMVVGVVDYGAWWHLLARLLSVTSQVCLDQMAQVWEDQEVLCISILTVRK